MAEDLVNELAKLKNEKSTMVEGWMATYGDMVTLLLCFFVLLFAFATIDVQKFRELTVSLKGTLGVLTGGERVLMPGDLPKPAPMSGTPAATQALAQPAPTESKDKGPEGERDSRESYQSGAGEVIVLPNIALFDENSDELSDRFKEHLDQMVPLIEYYKNNEISVIGHADPRPIYKPFMRDGYEIRSNWQVAANRALKVIEYFVNEKGISEERFSLTAYSSHKGPVDLRDASDYRRVDVIFRPKYVPKPSEQVRIDEFMKQQNNQ